MLLLVALCGWAMGSLVNYLADVLPGRRRLAAPYCLACQAEQPPANYFLWPRRCAICCSRRHGRVWLVEGLLLLATLATWLKPPDGIGFWLAWLLLGYLVLVCVIDLEHRLIMHPVSLAGVALSMPLGSLAHGWQATLLGGLAGFAAMLAVYLLGRVFTRVMRRRNPTIEEEALGFGDVNLGAITGLLLGWPGIVAGLLIAMLLGGAVALFYVVWSALQRNYRAAAVFPFGPTLVASVIYLLYF